MTTLTSNDQLKLKIELSQQFNQLIYATDKAVTNFVHNSPQAKHQLKDNAVYSLEDNIQLLIEKIYNCLELDGCKANFYLDLILLDSHPQHQSVLKAVFGKLISNINHLSVNKNFTDLQQDPLWALFTAQLNTLFYQAFENCSAIISRVVEERAAKQTQVA